LPKGESVLVSFQLTDEQKEIRDWVHDFAEREIRPVAHEYDEKEEFPWPVVQKAGSPEQIETWIPACYGTPKEPKVAAFCATEADAGSDVAAYKTAAVKKNGDWVLNGEKVFITNGGIADVHVVVASVDRSLGSRGHASFVVPPGTPGLSQGKKEKKLGIRASHTATVVLNDVRVPSDCLLGGEEKLEAKLARAREGSSTGRTNVAMKTFESTRPLVAAQALGIARAAFEFALRYAKERKAFGRPIIENQAIAFKLADMALEIEATRALIWRALWESRNGGDFKMAEGSMAKLKAGEVAVKVTDEAIQICGGYGYMREFPVEKWHRDAKIYTIFEGTSEIQRLVISRALQAL
jgi:acyl-CoA dehydrogenase